MHRHRLRARLLPAALALLFAAAALPLAAPAPAAAASTGLWQANCSVKLRAKPSTSATTKAVIPSGAIVTVSGVVSGSSYAAACRTNVSGTSWYVVTAIGGRRTSALYGVAQVYVAAKLFRPSWSPYLEGVDVSAWQPTIDFAAVRASGRTFVIAKASEGSTWKDPDYASFRAGAGAAGLAFGAYHFARPNATAGDAVREADFFIATAAIRKGDLRPVLDLEQTGGLSPTALANWASAFVGRVYARLGVKPLIYTSPSFWSTAVGNSSAFGSAGYKLWIANWNVTYPTIPGSSWGGTGWAVWQYSNCGSVRGIGGCVDLDRLRATDFSGITY